MQPNTVRHWARPCMMGPFQSFNAVRDTDFTVDTQNTSLNPQMWTSLLLLFTGDKLYVARNFMHVNTHTHTAIWSKKCVELFVRESKFMQISAFWNSLLFIWNRKLEKARFFAMTESHSSMCCCGPQWDGPKKTTTALCWSTTFYTKFLQLLSCFVLKKLNSCFTMRRAKTCFSIYMCFIHYRINASLHSEWSPLTRHYIKELNSSDHHMMILSVLPINYSEIYLFWNCVTLL